jgi:hypothetical protein
MQMQEKVLFDSSYHYFKLSGYGNKNIIFIFILQFTRVIFSVQTDQIS